MIVSNDPSVMNTIHCDCWLHACVSAQCYNKRAQRPHCSSQGGKHAVLGKRDRASRPTKSPLCARLSVWVCRTPKKNTPDHAGAALQVWADGDLILAFNVAHSLAPSATQCKSHWAELNNKCFPFWEGIGLNKQPEQGIISASVNVWLQSANWCRHWQLETGGSFLQGLHSTG